MLNILATFTLHNETMELIREELSSRFLRTTSLSHVFFQINHLYVLAARFSLEYFDKATRSTRRRGTQNLTKRFT